MLFAATAATRTTTTNNTHRTYQPTVRQTNERTNKQSTTDIKATAATKTILAVETPARNAGLVSQGLEKSRPVAASNILSGYFANYRRAHHMSNNCVGSELIGFHDRLSP